MAVITNIEDLKTIYRRRVPKMFYDYTESGSWSEQTFAENSSDFAQIRLGPVDNHRAAMIVAQRCQLAA